MAFIVVSCTDCRFVSANQASDPMTELSVGQDIRLHFLDNPNHILKVVLR